MFTDYSGERSFSQLSRIKNVKRSAMSQERLGVLALLCSLLKESCYMKLILAQLLINLPR